MENNFFNKAWILFGFFFLCNFSLQAGDVLSIHSYCNNDQKVYIFGVYPLGEKKSNSPFPQMYKNFLKDLSTSPTKTALILLTPRARMLEMMQGKFTPLTENFEGSVLHEAAFNNLKRRSVTYIPCDYPDAMFVQNFNTSITSYLQSPNKIVALSKNSIPKSYLAPIVLFTQNKHTSENPFLKDKKCFDALKIMIRKDAHSNLTYPCINDCLKMLNTYDVKFKALAEDQFTCSLKKEWLAASERLRSYLQGSGCPLNAKLIEVFFNTVLCKETYMPAYEEFMHTLFTPVNLITRLEQCLLVLEVLGKNKRVILYMQPYSLKDYSRLFDQKGFKETALGLSVKNEAIISPTQRDYFSPKELDAHFTAILNGTFESITQDEFSLKAPTDYYDPALHRKVKNPPQKHKDVPCFRCNTMTRAIKGFATGEDTIYCSLKCLQEVFYGQEKTTASLFDLLNETHTLSSEQKLLLKQFGALLYLRAALLMPSIGQEDGIVYQLPLVSLISKLNAIIKCPEANKPQIWKDTLEFCRVWKLDLQSLSMNLQVFNAIKTNYLNDLLQRRPKGKAYKEIEEIECLFDPTSRLSTLQQGWFVNLKKAFNFALSSDSTILLLLYSDLIDKIHKRVGIPFDNLESVLAIDYKVDDLQTVLAFIGHEENPLKVKQKKKETVKRLNEKRSLSSSDEQETLLSVQEETLSLLSLPSTPSSLEGFKLAYPPKKRVKIICGLFGNRKPYTISLFKARSLAPETLQQAHKRWRACTITKESYRIKLLFALAHQSAQQPECLFYNSYNTLALKCFSEEDSSITEKLDINHLFSRTVDKFVKRYGIAEERGTDLIQVSIAGKLKYDDREEIGFFQYSFTSKGVCIHRCFKPSTASDISSALQKVLRDFLD